MKEGQRKDLEKSEDRGLRCCKRRGRNFRVSYTRPALRGEAIRRRDCRNCAKRYHPCCGGAVSSKVDLRT